MFPATGSASAEIYARAQRVMPNGSSRKSLYEMRSYAQSGEGSRLYDVDGRTILDGSNNFMVLIHGHAHRPTLEAINRHMQDGVSFGIPAIGEVLLAEHLCQRVASVEQVVFCNSGTEAVMHAMKAARALTRRPKIAKCEGLYHGTYDYAEVSNAVPARLGTQGYPTAQWPGGYGAPHVLEDVIVVPYNDAELTERILREHGSQIGGFVIDLAPSRIGYVMVDPSYLRHVRALCDELGILLILDEVASFRIAYGGAQALYDVRPDLTAFGKIIGGGLPVGAVGGTKEAMRIFDPVTKDGVSFTGTFNANPLTMAAGLAALVDYGPESVDLLNAKGERLRARLRAGIADTGLPADVRGCSSFVSIFFGPRVGNGYHAIAHRPEELPFVRRFWSAVMDRGMLIDVSARLNLSTAYSDADVEEAATILLDALQETFDAAASARR